MKRPLYSRAGATPLHRFAPIHGNEGDAGLDLDIKRATFATTAVAVDGHRILPSAWQSKDHNGLADFIAQGSPLLFAHDGRSMPVGNIVGLRIAADSALTGGVKFNNVTPTAQALRELYRAGSMRSFSVGFLPLEQHYVRDAGRVPGAMDFTKVRLLEISCVPVPADGGALVQERSGPRGRSDHGNAADTPQAHLLREARARARQMANSDSLTIAEKDFFARRHLDAFTRRAAAIGAGRHVLDALSAIFSDVTRDKG
jgi:HK97 family phage prohead protease